MMKIAVISDIHGNLPSLKAVLEDAKENSIEKFIIAGDYCLSGPYPNECIATIKVLDNAECISVEDAVKRMKG